MQRGRVPTLPPESHSKVSTNLPRVPVGLTPWPLVYPAQWESGRGPAPQFTVLPLWQRRGGAEVTDLGSQ